nr:hypothetical protein CFP56_66717 [Quercus suber]
MRVSDLSPFELLNLGPGPPLTNTPEPTTFANITLDQMIHPISIPEEDILSENSMKRLRKEIERFSRNIRQMICYGFFNKDSQSVVSTPQDLQQRTNVTIAIVELENGFWEAGP